MAEDTAPPGAFEEAPSKDSETYARVRFLEERVHEIEEQVTAAEERVDERVDAKLKLFEEQMKGWFEQKAIATRTSAASNQNPANAATLESRHPDLTPPASRAGVEQNSANAATLQSRPPAPTQSVSRASVCFISPCNNVVCIMECNLVTTPGGRMEACDDGSWERCCIRETTEELGVWLGNLSRRLDEVYLHMFIKVAPIKS